MKPVSVLLLILCCVGLSVAQRPQVSTTDEKNENKPVKPAPDVVAAKYEGGMFGFSKKVEGKLKFDTPNERLIFLDKENKELFGIPYTSVIVAYPNTKSVVSPAGQVIGVVPYFGVLGGFIKEKRQYLVIHYSDPEVVANGIVSFKVEDEETLKSILYRLGQEAKLQQRGDAYYKARDKGKKEETKQ